MTFFREGMRQAMIYAVLTLLLQYGIVLAIKLGVITLPSSGTSSGQLSQLQSHLFIIILSMMVGIVTGFALVALRRGLRWL